MNSLLVLALLKTKAEFLPPVSLLLKSGCTQAPLFAFLDTSQDHSLSHPKYISGPPGDVLPPAHQLLPGQSCTPVIHDNNI